jgi:Rieske 2Fe-2S family protein
MSPITETQQKYRRDLVLGRRHLADPDWYEWERHHIFSCEWLFAGHIFQWPGRGSGVTCQIAGQPFLFLLQDDGSVRGFHNVCRHRGALLVDQPYPSCTKGIVTCPYHGWSYNLDGSLRAAPHLDATVDRDSLGLVPVAARIWAGFVFAQLEHRQVALHESWSELGQLLDRWDIPNLTAARELTYDVRANWKVLFQNYSECYHCPLVHPALNRLSPYQGTENQFTAGPILGGPMRLAEGVDSMTTTSRRVAPPLPGLTEKDRRSVYYFTLFPSCFLSLHPDYVMVHSLQPVTHDRTRIHCQFFFQTEVADSDGFDATPAVEFWDLTNRQDWEVCERVQRGALSSTFQPGPYSDRESMVAAFDRHYLDVVADAQKGD